MVVFHPLRSTLCFTLEHRVSWTRRYSISTPQLCMSQLKVSMSNFTPFMLRYVVISWALPTSHTNPTNRLGQGLSHNDVNNCNFKLSNHKWTTTDLRGKSEDCNDLLIDPIDALYIEPRIVVVIRAWSCWKNEHKMSKSFGKHLKRLTTNFRVQKYQNLYYQSLTTTFIFWEAL